MTRVTKIIVLLAVALVLLGGSTAGACKLAFDCGIRSQQGDAPPIEQGQAVLPAGWAERTVVSGISGPTDFAFLPDGRAIITEKDGLVKLAELEGGPAEQILDLTAQVSTFDIRGLLTVTVDPGFPDQPYVYLLYTGATDDDAMVPTTTYLSRFMWDDGTLDPGSERRLLEIDQQEAHAGGQIVFAPDGTMFVSTGDAAASNGKEPDALRAQDVSVLQGKVLRITPDGRGVESNPFWNGDADADRSKVWATGFRNPFRIALQPGSETPVVGELGFLEQDEIDVIRKGANYGWPCFEGQLQGPGDFPQTPTCEALYAKGSQAVTAPTAAYDHEEAASLTGGAFYDGDAYPEEYRGAYFYADFAYGWLRYLRLDERGELAGEPADFGSKLPGPVAIHTGPDGKLYYLSLTTGELRRLDEPS